MYRSGLILAGLVGGMVMLGGGPALAAAHVTAAPVVAHSGCETCENRGDWNNFGNWENNGINLVLLNDLIDLL